MGKILENFRDSIFQSFLSGDIYFKTPERSKYKLKDIARIAKNLYPVEYNKDTITVYDNSFGDIRYHEDSFYSNSHEFIVISNNCDSYYIYCILRTLNLYSKMSGTYFKFLTKETLADSKIILPTLEEQILIGRFMKLIDTKIELERRKV